MEHPKIAFATYNIPTCGGLIVVFEYVKELRRRGISADIYADDGNDDLEKHYNIFHLPTARLSELTDNDVLIAVRWEQINDLEQYKGRKIQFVQGNDKYYYENAHHDDLPKMMEARNNKNWELMGVSEYVLENWGRGFVIPNGISDKFFIDYGSEKDIDALVEGNNEDNKNIPYAIEQAIKDGHKKIVWMGRETNWQYADKYGIEIITNPPQEEIPKIYQRAKHFYKYSKSEGFSLPLWEAAASGCIVHTHDMGCNRDWVYTKEEAQKYTWKNATDKLLKII